MACVTCEHAGGHDLVASNALAAAFADGFPLTPNHTLIVPRRHESDFLALSPAERAAIWDLVPDVCRHIEVRRHRLNGYNIGINIGEAAGQTIGHAHLHVIPRYEARSRTRVVASDGLSRARLGTGTRERRTRRHRLRREDPRTAGRRPVHGDVQVRGPSRPHGSVPGAGPGGARKGRDSRAPSGAPRPRPGYGQQGAAPPRRAANPESLVRAGGRPVPGRCYRDPAAPGPTAPGSSARSGSRRGRSRSSTSTRW